MARGATPAEIRGDHARAGAPAETREAKLRPGSGYLSVKVITDGPTRVLQIHDMQQNKDKAFARTEAQDWSETKRPWIVTNEGLRRCEAVVLQLSVLSHTAFCNNIFFVDNQTLLSALMFTFK